MGFRDWMRRATSRETETDAVATGGGQNVGDVDDAVTFTMTVQVGPDWGSGEPMKMVGTTTEAADECRHMFAFKGLPDGGHFESPATLVAVGAEGRADPVVAVHVDGARVGFLPGFMAALVNPDNKPLSGAAAAAQVQMWGAHVGDGMRVIGWVAAGSAPVSWPHSEVNPAAVTVEEQRAEAAASTASMIREALEGDDPRRAEEFRRGLVDGVHYLQTIEPIKQLKGEGKLEEALELCYRAIEGAEADREDREPAPWYTEQAAIIHRKRGEREQEIAVLRRWLDVCPPDRRAGSAAQVRLDKLVD